MDRFSQGLPDPQENEELPIFCIDCHCDLENAIFEFDEDSYCLECLLEKVGAKKK